MAVLATVDSLTIVVSGIPPLMLMHTVINPADSSTVMAVSKNMTLATEQINFVKLKKCYTCTTRTMAKKNITIFVTVSSPMCVCVHMLF